MSTVTNKSKVVYGVLSEEGCRYFKNRCSAQRYKNVIEYPISESYTNDYVYVYFLPLTTECKVSEFPIVTNDPIYFSSLISYIKGHAVNIDSMRCKTV